MFSRLKSSPIARFAGIFIVLLIGATGLLKAQTGSVPQRPGANLSLSPVILVERPEAVQDLFTADARQVRQMVNEALLKLTSAPDIGTAWTRLGITPQDVVGIKITTAGGLALCTHHSLVSAICDGLHAAGVPSSQIIIWDKFEDKMRPAGYVPRPASQNQAAIASIVPGNNYDPGAFYRNGMFGNLMWGDYLFLRDGDSDDTGSNRAATRSYYTKFVTQICTKLINVPVLTDNRFVGINGCLSSLALASVDNNRRFQGPPTYGDPAIDEILDQKFIRGKVVVHILDALVAQCAGGPAFNPQFCQPLGAIYVGRDPVAIDSLALPRLEKLCRQMGLPPIGNTASHIKSAVYYQLGTTDRRRIQLVRLP
jgi:hypothetical protein